MKILAVCLGNICRSPLAHGILQNLADDAGFDWTIDSAGTSDYHIGEAPCSGSISVAEEQGIFISKQRSRQIHQNDFEYFDLILAMDTSNYNDLYTMATNKTERDKIKLILDFSFPGQNRAVPDSYYTGNYEEVFDLLYDACLKIIESYPK